LVGDTFTQWAAEELNALASAGAWVGAPSARPPDIERRVGSCARAGSFCRPPGSGVATVTSCCACFPVSGEVWCRRLPTCGVRLTLRGRWVPLSVACLIC